MEHQQDREEDHTHVSLQMYQKRTWCVSWWWQQIQWSLVSLYVASAFGIGVVALPLLFALSGRLLGSALLIFHAFLTWKVLCDQVRSITAYSLREHIIINNKTTTSTTCGAAAGTSEKDRLQQFTTTQKDNDNEETRGGGSGGGVPVVLPLLGSFNEVVSHTIAKPAAFVTDLSVFFSVELALVFAVLVIVGCISEALEQLTGSTSAAELATEGSWLASKLGLIIMVTSIATLWSLRPNLLDHTVANACAGITVFLLIVVLAIVLVIQGGVDGGSTEGNSKSSASSSHAAAAAGSGGGSYTGFLPTSFMHLLQALPVFIGSFSLSYNTPVLVTEVALRSARRRSTRETGDETHGNNEEEDHDASTWSSLTLRSLMSTKDKCVTSITVAISIIAASDLALGLLATSALTYASVLKGDGSVLASLPKPLHFHYSTSAFATNATSGGGGGDLEDNNKNQYLHHYLSEGDQRVLYVSTVTIRLLVALHVISIFPVFATTARQAFLRLALKLRAHVKERRQSRETDNNNNTGVVIQVVGSTNETEGLLSQGLQHPSSSNSSSTWNIKSLPLHIMLALPMSVVVVILCYNANGVGVILGLNCAIFAPAIALAIPAYSSWWLLFKKRRGEKKENRPTLEESTPSSISVNAAGSDVNSRSGGGKLAKGFTVALALYCTFVTITGILSWV